MFNLFQMKRLSPWLIVDYFNSKFINSLICLHLINNWDRQPRSIKLHLFKYGLKFCMEGVAAFSVAFVHLFLKVLLLRRTGLDNRTSRSGSFERRQYIEVNQSKLIETSSFHPPLFILKYTLYKYGVGTYIL